MGFMNWMKKPVKGTFQATTGAGEALGNVAGGATAAAAKIATAPARAGAKVVGESAKIVAGATAHGAAAGAGIIRGFFKTKFGKITGIGALAGAGLILGSIFMGKSRGKARRAEQDEAFAQAMTPAAPPQMGVETGPADGRDASYWQQTVGQRNAAQTTTGRV
jgi:hypothetical protein